ncbi:hypothetical protein L195_g060871, partial [Trifolium pratense]
EKSLGGDNELRLGTTSLSSNAKVNALSQVVPDLGAVAKRISVSRV